MMDRILAGLDFCFVFLDDILVACPDHKQHAKHLAAVLARLQEHGLVPAGSRGGGLFGPPGDCQGDQAAGRQGGRHLRF